MSLGGIIGGTVGGLIGVAATNYLVKRSKKKMTETEQLEFQQLEAVYRPIELQLDRFASLVILPSLVVCCYLCRQLALARLKQFPNAVVALPPDFILSMGPGLIWAVSMGFVAHHYWTKKKLGAEYSSYKRYRQIKNRYLKLVIVVLLILALPGIAGTFAYYDQYLIIEPDRIVLNDEYSIGGNDLPFSQIRDIKLSRAARKDSGELVGIRPHYTIYFSTGQTFESNTLSSFHVSFVDYEKVFAYISKAANIPIQEVPEIKWADR